LEVVLRSLLPTAAGAKGEVASAGTTNKVNMGRKSSLSGIQVMAYVLGVPLVGGIAFLLWRQSRDHSSGGGGGGVGGRKMVEPWYALLRMPTSNQHPRFSTVPNGVQ
jgi:hypothetical protein